MHALPASGIAFGQEAVEYGTRRLLAGALFATRHRPPAASALRSIRGFGRRALIEPDLACSLMPEDGVGFDCWPLPRRRSRTIGTLEGVSLGMALEGLGLVNA